MLWEPTTSEENYETTMDCSSFQLQHTRTHNRIEPTTATTSRNRHRLNMDSSLLEMAVDELSFYDDDAPTALSSASPQPLGLLLPAEESPQRFLIVEQKAPQPKFLPPLARQQKLQNATRIITASATSTSTSTSTTSSNSTPAKSFRIFHSLSSGSMESSSMDDEYMELFEMESLEQQMPFANFTFPSNLNSLISGQIRSASPAAALQCGALIAKTPEMRRPSVRRCLSMTENQTHLHQPKIPELLNKQLQETNTTPFSSRLTNHCLGSNPSPLYCFKRPDPPSTTSSPIQPKRYRGGDKENLDGSYGLSRSPLVLASSSTCVPRPLLRKCMSMNDAQIMTALARSDCKDEPDLIGDFTKPFALPIMEGRHRDLKSITSDTVARLLRGDFDEKITSYKIIDCRYPYEFDGGHIRGAKNLYTQEQIMEEFLSKQDEPGASARSTNTNEGPGNPKHSIIIFHCEFSSERGPKLSRFLRNNDRARNTNSYPALDYPEIYLLHNGYKEFYETHAELCEPVAYRPMLEPSYNEEYRHFRSKSKSWNGDGLGGGTSRLKKSRSRLLL